jgi:hypothetical protein
MTPIAAEGRQQVLITGRRRSGQRVALDRSDLVALGWEPFSVAEVGGRLVMFVAQVDGHVGDQPLGLAFIRPGSRDASSIVR